MGTWRRLVMSTQEESRTRLLETAGEIFAQKGFHAATVREICRQAGVNIASVSYYFGDKEGLYVEAVKQAARNCAGDLRVSALGPDTPAAARLHHFVRTFLERVVVNREPSWHALLLLREMASPTRACVEFVKDFVRPNFEAMQAILADLLPADVPAVKRHLIGFSIIGQCLHYRMARGVITLLVGPEEFGTYDVDRLADHITGFTLAALGHREHGRAKGGRA
jgi:AcrR family transcriptional regulator